MSYTSSWRGHLGCTAQHKLGAWLLELELHGNSCACEFVHARGTPVQLSLLGVGTVDGHDSRCPAAWDITFIAVEQRAMSQSIFMRVLAQL